MRRYLRVLSAVGAVYDRGFVPLVCEDRAVIDRAYSRLLPRRWGAAVLLVLLLLALNSIAFAQRPTVTLQGIVLRDASGDPLSKARVELRGGPLEPTTTI